MCSAEHNPLITNKLPPSYTLSLCQATLRVALPCWSNIGRSRCRVKFPFCSLGWANWIDILFLGGKEGILLRACTWKGEKKQVRAVPFLGPPDGPVFGGMGRLSMGKWARCWWEDWGGVFEPSAGGYKGESSGSKGSEWSGANIKGTYAQSGGCKGGIFKKRWGRENQAPFKDFDPSPSPRSATPSKGASKPSNPSKASKGGSLVTCGYATLPFGFRARFCTASMLLRPVVLCFCFGFSLDSGLDLLIPFHTDLKGHSAEHNLALRAAWAKKTKHPQAESFICPARSFLWRRGIRQHPSWRPSAGTLLAFHLCEPFEHEFLFRLCFLCSLLWLTVSECQFDRCCWITQEAGGECSGHFVLWFLLFFWSFEIAALTSADSARTYQLLTAKTLRSTLAAASTHRPT